MSQYLPRDYYNQWPIPAIEHSISRMEVKRNFDHIRKWDGRYLRLLDDNVVGVRSWSKDPSTWVAAGLVTPDNRLINVAFNGFPAGMRDYPERYEERAFKHRWVQHAERNSLDLAPGGKLTGHTMYVTSMPCTHCAGTIISRGITRVVGILIDGHEDMPTDDWRYYVSESLEIFREADVEYSFYRGTDLWSTLEKSVSSEDEPDDEIPF